ncbi:MAG: FAD:protein FMN transferase, partial [bacterium]|nr:FAD:protein FMN transferase [bacterium]
GYIVDKAVALLKEAKVKHIIVDAGGDVFISGGRPGRFVWDEARAALVGVQNPFNPSELVAIIRLFHGAVLTSGDYQRFFVQDNVRYSHILDPRTGYPARGVSSVTITGPNAALADAVATAVFVLGRERGLILIDSWPEIEGMIIGEDEQISMSKGMEDITEILR